MFAVADPDFQVRGRPGHPESEISGGAGLKIFFRPFGPHFGIKIRGSPGPPGPSPGSATGLQHYLVLIRIRQMKAAKNV